jgi:hypothetical protein
MGSLPRAESISSSELIERIVAIADARGRAGSAIPQPQGLDVEAGPWVACDVFPWRKRADRPELALPARLSINVADFVVLPAERFVKFCHHALLGRDPTARETDLWSRRVRGGWPRLAVVLAIRWSRDGRRRRTRLRGLVTRTVRDLLFMLRQAKGGPRT